MQQMKPGSRSLDAIPLLEQFEPRRPDTVKSHRANLPLVTGIGYCPHRMDRLHFGDEARMEDDLRDAPAYRQRIRRNLFDTVRHQLHDD